VHIPRSLVLIAALCLAGSCGGDSGPTETPPDNTPAAIVIAPSTSQSLVSGSTVTFTGTVTARDGHVIVNASVVWTSSDPAVGVITGPQLLGVKAGTTTVTATSGGVSASVSVTVTPGAVRQVGIRTQPVGAAIGAVLATQPVLEFQDAAGNLVPSSTNFATATIASGGGVLSGTTTIAAVAGVVTFTDLRITGTAGARTLSFTAGAISATSTPFTMTPPPTPFIAVDTNAVSFSVPLGANPAPRAINVTNLGAQALTGMSVDVVYDSGQPLGWLSATLDKPDAPAVLTLAATSASMVEGTYHATVHVTGPGAPNSPLSIGVTLVITLNYTIAYGTSAEKVKIIDAGATFAPTLSILDQSGQPVPGISPTFTSRATTVARVAADGKITAVAGGDAWIVASTALTSDSVFVIVPRSASAPIVRSDATTFTARLGDTLFANVVLDTRASTVGAASLAVEITVQSGSLTFFYSVPAGNPAPIVSNQGGVIRISLGSANGMTGVVPVLNFKILARSANTVGWLNLFALDVSGVDGTSMTAQSTSTRLPYVIR
jgi:hypothetical protein